MKFYIIAAVLACAALIGGAVYLSTRPAEVQTQRLIPVNASYTEHLKNGGWSTVNPAAKVQVIEYGDLQCPACGNVYQPLKDSIEATKDIVAFTFYHFPLPQHNKSMQAAIGAEAAGRQGKFWEMHDLLYAHQSDWSEDLTFSFNNRLSDYAANLGLNVEQFKRDLTDPSTADEVQKDIGRGNKVPVTGTPTILINGKNVDKIIPTKEYFTGLIRQAASDAATK